MAGTRLFFLHYPVEVPAEYEFFSLKPIPPLQFKPGSYAAFQSDLEAFAYAEWDMLEMVPFSLRPILIAAAFFCLVMLATICCHRRDPLILWRAAFAFVAVSWACAEPLLDTAAAHPMVRNSLLSVQGQFYVVSTQTTPEPGLDSPSETLAC